MTLPECTAILSPLAVALRVDVDVPTFRAYHRTLTDVPPRLLEMAVERAMKSATFMPKPGELRKWAEEARLSMRASVKFLACESCSSGWTELEDGGVRKVVRCGCWKAHQARIDALGVGSTPLELPAASDGFERIGDSDAA